MKGFFKIVFGTVTGLILFSLLSFFLMIFVLVAISAGADAPEQVTDKTVLRINLSGVLQERSEESLYSLFGEESEPALGLDDVLTSIKQASSDDHISGILITSSVFDGGYASLKEIRDELIRFKRSGKFVYAYSGEYTQKGYYLASVADSVFLNPDGAVDFSGMAYRSIFVKSLLEKVGVGIQVVKVGSFKSYTEMFTNTSMSDSSRLQADQLLKDMWGSILSEISASRKIPVQTLIRDANSFVNFSGPEEARRIKLVDKLLYADEVTNLIKKRLDIEAKEDINYISPSAYAQTVSEDNSSSDHVAVLYAVGEIDNGSTDGINTIKLCKEIEKLKNNDKVKAVVLRVNSPGGSAYGSEQVWHALQLLRDVKPVVVSMGDYAASGGYYISCGADYIVAEPTTMTGSIGIFGVIPNGKELAKKIGVDYDVVKTNKYADFPSVVDSLSAEDLAVIQQSVERGYAKFIDRCAKGRGVDAAKIEKYAQGHVWSGKSALAYGLVDTLGSLDLATDLAARQAKISDYKVVAYPKKQSPWESLVTNPSLGVKLFFPNEPFEEERKLLERINKIDRVQALMPNMVDVK